MVKIGIHNLTFAYRKHPVLKSLSLDIRQGKITAVIGPNGSGKSTLIKCINRILNARQGDISVDGVAVKDRSRRQIAQLMAYVPQQEFNVFPATVYETILMGRKPFIGWSPRQSDYELVNCVLHDLDLESISMEMINELSGGQRQRVLIGRALAQQPEILLLDEPTANLDMKHQLEVMLLLRKLAAEGITVVIAIHELNLAARYCDEFALLNDGALFASGGREVLSEENIRALYGVNVQLLKTEGHLFIVPEMPAG